MISKAHMLKTLFDRIPVGTDRELFYIARTMKMMKSLTVGGTHESKEDSLTLVNLFDDGSVLGVRVDPHTIKSAVVTDDLTFRQKKLLEFNSDYLKRALPDVIDSLETVYKRSMN